MIKTLILFCLFSSYFAFGQNNISPSTAPSKKDDLKDIPVITVCYDYPDHDAWFLDGKEDFVERLKNVISSDGLKMEGEKNFKSILNFIVERDGTISEIKASGTNEKFNNAVKVAAKRIKGKWVPAKQNCNSVKSKIQFQILMNFH